MKSLCNKWNRFALLLALLCATVALRAQEERSRGPQQFNTASLKTVTSIIAESGRQIDRGAYDSAIATCRQGLSLCSQIRRGPIKRSVLYNYIGASFQFKGDFDSAIHYFYLAIHHAEQVDSNSLQLIRIYNNLSLTFNRTLNNEKALMYLDQAEALAKATGQRGLIPPMLLNKARIYKEEEKFKRSEATFLEALELCRDTTGIRKASGLDPDVIRLMVYTNLGQLHIVQDQFSTAEGYLKKALPISESANPYYQIPVKLALGKAYFHQKKYLLAENNILSALSKSEAAQISDALSEGHFLLSGIYKAKGEYYEAYNHLMQAYELEEKIRGVERTKDTRLLEIKYHTAQQAKELAEKKLTVANKDRLLKNKNLWIAGVSLSTLMLSVLLFIGYKNYRHRQHLQEQKILAIEQSRHIEILKATAEGEETERKRIAGNLHDGIGSIISAAKMNFSTLHTLDSDQAVYAKSMQLLNDAAFELRTTAHNLMPQILLKEGLTEATRDFCERVSNSQSLTLEFQAYGDFAPLDKSFELSVYRMIQELVNNIIKHAEARKALVQLSRSRDMLAITIEDNGRGMTDPLQSNTGAGLKNIAAQVQRQQGQMTIESTAGKGTQIYIEFDLPEA